MAEHQRSNLQQYQQNISVENKQLSIYFDKRLDPDTWAMEVIKLRKAFQGLNADWFDILLERAKDRGFTNKRLSDAVNHAIDSCKYPTPTISDIINFDRHIEALTEMELMEKCERMGLSYKHQYVCIDLNGRPYWIKKRFQEAYKFQLWQPKQYKNQLNKE